MKTIYVIGASGESLKNVLAKIEGGITLINIDSIYDIPKENISDAIIIDGGELRNNVNLIESRCDFSKYDMPFIPKQKHSKKGHERPYKFHP